MEKDKEEEIVKKITPFPANYPRKQQFSHSLASSLEVCRCGRTCSRMMGKTAGSLTLFGRVNSELIWGLWEDSTCNNNVPVAVLPSDRRHLGEGGLWVSEEGGCLQWRGQQTTLSNQHGIRHHCLTVFVSGVENSGPCEYVRLSRSSVFCVLFTRMGDKGLPLLRAYLFYRMRA